MRKINTYLSSLIIFLICLHVQARSAHIKIVAKKGLPLAPVCGYDSCPKPEPGKLNVHLIAHTHDDVGWLKTVDQYYYGAKNDIQKAGVQYILDSVVQELLKDPSKRFIYVESAFFMKWWHEQDDHLRHQVQMLVRSGRLELVGGGWSMNDEATTHYQSTIDQLSWGLRKLNDTFGPCGRPRVGWQIDPFGHSREFASTLAGMGYDGLFLGRLDFQDKASRLDRKEMEQIWLSSDNLGESRELFTSVLYNNYGPPPGFCFDILCEDEPIIDNKHSPDYNVDAKAKNFTEWILSQHESYHSKQLILTMGGDFTYQDAQIYYKNLDKLIKYVNEAQSKGSIVNVFYSTPSCYLKAVNDEKLQWNTKSDDFFPYASDPHSYWTGYFSSRPTIKYFERLGNNFLQVCKQMASQSQLSASEKGNITKLREAMGIMQHHDAITGTEKQHVANDYARILTAAMDECQLVAESALNKLSAITKETPRISWKSCLLANQSSCEVSEKSTRFVVTIYNPQSHLTNEIIRLPIINSEYSIYEPNGKQVVVDVFPIPSSVLNLKGRVSNATHELVFLAENLPPLGFRSYFVVQEKGVGGTTLPAQESPDNFIHSDKSEVKYDHGTGEISVTKLNGNAINVKVHSNYYEGFIGDNKEFANRSSGAYIFRPKSSPFVPISNETKTNVFKGRLIEEMHVTFNSWSSQIIRLNRFDGEVEINWLIGPIPIEDNVGKEVVTLYKTDISSEGIFYTDSNGRELLKRTRNARPTWKLNLQEPVAGNYYPVVTQIGLRDQAKNLGFVVVTDRAQGGSSLSDGQIELMLHRRLLHDDAFGVGEALNETAYGEGLIVRGRHWLMAGSLTQHPTVRAAARNITQKRVLAPWAFLTPTNLSLSDWSNSHLVEMSGLQSSLPENIQILTLEPWKGHTLLLRLEHIYEKGEDIELSRSATVNLQGLFTHFGIKELRETTLDGNQWLSETYRLSWNKESNNISSHIREVMSADYTKKKFHEKDCPNDKMKPTSSTPTKKQITSELEINLEPMEIRTFVLYLN